MWLTVGVLVVLLATIGLIRSLSYPHPITHEIQWASYGMVHIAHKARAEYVEFNPTNGFNHKILVNPENCGLFRKAERDIVAECEKLDQPYKLLRPLDLGLADQLVMI